MVMRSKMTHPRAAPVPMAMAPAASIECCGHICGRHLAPDATEKPIYNLGYGRSDFWKLGAIQQWDAALFAPHCDSSGAIALELIVSEVM